jgi:hypothetical protein
MNLLTKLAITIFSDIEFSLYFMQIKVKKHIYLWFNFDVELFESQGISITTRKILFVTNDLKEEM